MSVHQIPDERVRELALDALHRACDGIRRHMCDTAVNETALLLEEYGHDVRGATRAPVRGAKHFVGLLNAADYARRGREPLERVADAQIRDDLARRDEYVDDQWPEGSFTYVALLAIGQTKFVYRAREEVARERDDAEQTEPGGGVLIAA